MPVSLRTALGQPSLLDCAQGFVEVWTLSQVHAALGASHAALEWIEGATHATPGLTEAELGRLLAGIGKAARAALSAAPAPTLPVEIHGKHYEVPIPVQVYIAALREFALATFEREEANASNDVKRIRASQKRIITARFNAKDAASSLEQNERKAT